MAAARVTAAAPPPPPPSSASTRTPLLPSDLDNAPRRPRGSKVVSSRYLSAASSTKRCPSPGVSRATTGISVTATATATATPLVKRSQSAERRREVARDSADGRGGSVRRTLASVRSLSVSFQGESYSVPVDRVDSTAVEKSTRVSVARVTSGGGSKGMLRGSVDNLKAVMEQKHRWPGRSAISKSVDFESSSALRQMSVLRDLENSEMEIDLRGPCYRRNDDIGSNNDQNFVIRHDRICSSNDSDNESASSGSIPSVKESNSHVPGALSSVSGVLNGIRGIKVQARFGQESCSRLAQPPSPMAASSRLSSTPKIVSVNRPGSDGPFSSPKGYASRRGQASPSRGEVRSASPSKFSSSSSLPSSARGLSPSRVRGVRDDSVISAPSISCFALEARRGKMGESKILGAHALRLSHNQLLQWRFVNARTDYTLSAQTLNAEGCIYNSWLNTLKLRESVKEKTLRLQMLRHILKLSSVLNGQMVHLEKWASMDGDYSTSLSGAIDSLHASTLRLPVIGGARVSVEKLKHAISSALEMLQAMANFICISLPKVGGVRRLVSELSYVASQERALLVQCRDLSSTNDVLQVKECSLRAHMLQQSSPLVEF